MPTVPVYQRQSQSQAAPVNTQDLRIPKDNAAQTLVLMRWAFISSSGNAKIWRSLKTP